MIARRLMFTGVVSLCVVVGLLLLGSAVALAAGVPAIEGESFTDIGSSSVTLNSQIDPNGESTSYYYEYGSSTAYGSRTPEVFLGEGESALPAPAHVEGLTTSGEYHFRVVAVGEAGTERGADETFRTLSVGLLGLPDGRVYERVTPTDERGFSVYASLAIGDRLSYAEGLYTERPFQAAANGDGVVYVASPSTSGGSGSSGEYEGNDYLATRSPGGGWTQVNLQPPGYRKAEYQAFSDDLSTGWLIARGESGFEEELPPLSPEAPGKYKVLYARSNNDGTYQPLFTKTATIHRGDEEFGAYQAGETLGAENPATYAGSSANLSEMLFEANDALTGSAVDGGKRENNLYLSVDGRLSLVNVLPDGSSSEANATFGGPPIGGEGTKFSTFPDFSHVISADGSRVFWTQIEGEKSPALYVRENPAQPQSPIEGGRCTVPADGCTVLISEGGRFWTATVDGSKVFFTKGDLYEYDVEDGLTTDLTPGVEVQGVIGASEDGEYIYYVDTSDELEMWHAGTSTAITQLSGRDGEEVGPYKTYRGPRGDWTPGLGTRTAEVAPDGLGVVFMSRESLPAVGFPEGYRDEGMEEVYAYEAQGGRLFCVSCNPSGEPPERNQETEAGLDNEADAAAAFLPISYSHTYAPRVISDGGGRVFFDSAEPLVAQDTNGKQDVYEWERDGVGSCREADGCIYLLSGGTSGSASWLLDASTSGEDVFVISRAELVPGDAYEGFAVYDARVGGVQPVVAPECTGSGCQGVPPAAPIFATPASVTFAGVGNFPAPSSVSGSVKSKPKPKAKVLTRAQKLARALRACRKRTGRARLVCEAQARRRYAPRSKAMGSAREGR